MMAHMNSLHVVRFFRFMRLFGVTMFSVLHSDHNYIRALVACDDGCEFGIPNLEESQEVQWACSMEPLLDDALTLGEYAYDAGWIYIDKMTIEPETLQTVLGWDVERVAAATQKLLRIRARMIDDGEATDVFFLHL